MSKRKKSVKKVSKRLDQNACCCNCSYNIGLIKLSAIAFILFLITVWTRFHDLIVGIHWGWFLGLTIIFGLIAATKNGYSCNCRY